VAFVPGICDPPASIDDDDLEWRRPHNEREFTGFWTFLGVFRPSFGYLWSPGFIIRSIKTP
jgi:hypothetical protein